MVNGDPDFRYMALNDLSLNLQKENFNWTSQEENSVVNGLIKLFKDNNFEVQNLAVKTLTPLVKKLSESKLSVVIDNLFLLYQPNQDKSDALRDVASIGLKTIIIELSELNLSKDVNVIKGLTPNSHANIKLDMIDLLSEVLSKYGSHVQNFQTELLRTFLPLLSNQNLLIRKRTAQALGNLSIILDEKLFDELVEHIKKLLKENGNDMEQLRTLVGCLTILSRTASRKSGHHLKSILPIVLPLIQIDNDELREISLQLLESYVLRCPNEITPELLNIISLGVQYLKYDPNYGEDDMDVDEDNMEEDADEENEEFGDDDLEDDDDMSWKVRKSAAKLLSAVISTRPELITEFLQNVSLTLIQRFSEREETVRVEVLQTFTTLIKIIRPFRLRDDPASPKNLLRAQVPKLTTKLSKQLKSLKCTQTRQTGFQLLKELVLTLDGVLSDYFDLFLNPIGNSLATSTTNQAFSYTNPNLKIETLQFLKTCLQKHDPSVFSNCLDKLIKPILSSANERYYKITAEALMVIVELVKVIRPDVMISSPVISKQIEEIYDTIMKNLSTADADLEVKERLIVCLGAVLSQAGDIIPQETVSKIILPLLVDRLKNEFTRNTTAIVIKRVAESPLGENGVSLLPLFPEVCTELNSSLKKTSSKLKSTSINTLESLYKRYENKISAKELKDLALKNLQELKFLFSLEDSDLHILPTVLSLVSCLIEVTKGENTINYIRGNMLSSLIEILIKSPHLLSSGGALDSLLRFFKTLSRFSNYNGHGDQLVSETVQSLKDAAICSAITSGTQQIPKQCLSLLSQCISEVCLAGEADNTWVVQKREEILKQFYRECCNSTTVEKGKQSTIGVEATKYLALMSLGEFGRRFDISNSCPKLDETLLSLLSNSVIEEGKQAAAFALGNVALGNLELYMPAILNAVKSSKKELYSVLLALREIISKGSTKKIKLLEKYSMEIFELLFFQIESNLEEGTRIVLSECLGKLCIFNPTVFLKEFLGLLKSPSSNSRQTVVTAIRYTFNINSGSDEYDNLLKPILSDFLKLVEDEVLSVRRASLATLSSAAHQKPHLIGGSLNVILPLLYKETVINSSLIYVVEMGPFKHTVDDGLEARKAAYDCMNTLFETCFHSIELNTFLGRIVQGLSDPSPEIKMICYNSIQNLLKKHQDFLISQKLDEIVEPLKIAVLTETKANAVKLEKEKNFELVRASTKLGIVLMKNFYGLYTSSGDKGSQSNLFSSGLGQPKFEEFCKEVLMSGSSPVSEIVNNINLELNEGVFNFGSGME
ncbi:Cullin-associated NEDD8-dissociated protein 1 [Clydaea vesicula]|uniref:Cullin-associated NEDD8-dissociated protein 1 n=1 Tax=Clydaea vesicula TaxID=447962 RepID=A0AAD5Y028_9FUNG|nr:Cullin-associated NEDD8-dissociated protein 1 [Clydaea vesicula]